MSNPTYLQCLPREILDIVFGYYRTNVRSYVTRSESPYNNFAYVWESYETKSRYALFLPMNPEEYSVRLMMETSTGSTYTDFKTMMVEIGGRNALQIEYHPKNVKLMSKFISVCLTQNEKQISIITGGTFGSMYVVSERHYDHFMIWITYVLNQWNADMIFSN